ncbi:MAG: redox-active disulfide protein 2 [Spirochaetes bacterium DG_61]|jgi:small redox-active disulfide protein 2|nr:MAG: redox-active disulfide protein 2 [Spirochaetes bacterium DG_61]
MIIKILGTGCPKCNKLESNTKEALKQSGVTATVQKVTNLNDILKYNVIMTPALVIDEEVKSSGKVLTVEQLTGLIRK